MKGEAVNDIKRKRSESDLRGATMVEYVLLLSLVFILGLGAVQFFATGVSTQFSGIASAITPIAGP